MAACPATCGTCDDAAQGVPTVIDLYGDIQTDGEGTAWEYRDAFAYRSDTVTTPTASFDLSEWTVAAPDCSDTSTNNCDSACGPYPDASFTCPLARQSVPALIIKGVLDIQTPQRGTSGKAIQLLAVGDVPDLSLFGLGIANNGGGTDGMEVDNLPAIHLRPGSKFWILNEGALDHAGVNPFEAYFGGTSVFATGVDGVDFHVHNDISQNGDDAVELFYAGRAIDLYGDLGTDGTSTLWEYRDAFAYRSDAVTTPTASFDLSEWTVAAPDCSDTSTNNCDSACGPYPDASFTCPLTVAPLATIRVSTGPYIVGEPIDVLFDGATSATDWVGFYSAGSDLHSYTDWVYHHGSADNTGDLITSGIVQVTPPSAGDYFIAFLGGGGYDEIADRIEISVVFDTSSRGAPRLRVGPGPYHPNAPVDVSFSGATSSTDWIGFYAAGSDLHDYNEFVYHHGSTDDTGDLLTSGTVQVTPPTAGDYFVAFLGNNGYVEIAPRIEIRVR